MYAESCRHLLHAHLWPESWRALCVLLTKGLILRWLLGTRLTIGASSWKFCTFSLGLQICVKSGVQKSPLVKSERRSGGRLLLTSCGLGEHPGCLSEL